MAGIASIIGPSTHPKVLIGMVHVGALPGTPRSAESVGVIASRAAEEAALLVSLGFDAVLIENMHDAPYLMRRVGPEIVAGMSAVAGEVRRAVSCPVGIQILAGVNDAAVAVAHACGLVFVRAEGFVFASVADEGVMPEADAGPLLRYRRAIGAAGVKVLADIKKKHSSHAITADVDIAETARAAEFFGADGVIVTGAATGRETSLKDLRAVRDATTLPLLVGSGATEANVGAMLGVADGVIVGSSIKEGGLWSRAIDPRLARRFVEAARRA